MSSDYIRSEIDGLFEDLEEFYSNQDIIEKMAYQMVQKNIKSDHFGPYILGYVIGLLNTPIFRDRINMIYSLLPTISSPEEFLEVVDHLGESFADLIGLILDWLEGTVQSN